jgi:hypothetical protein
MFAWAAVSLPAASRFSFHVVEEDASGWKELLSSMGLVSGSAADAGVVVAGRDAAIRQSADAQWATRVESGTVLVLEGASPLAAAFGFRNSGKPPVSVRSVEDMSASDLRVIWEKSADVPQFEMPAGARVFARERWQKTPLVAGFRKGAGAVLWVAASPGAHGYERFPYLPQALAELGVEPPFRSRRLWAFFDSAYRARVDLDYFAERWRAAGISALHVAAWHYWERDAQNDEYLRQLIEACHRNAIQVYAWLELPHVSEKFWYQHPEWREKTALLQDAQLDWRKLINLTNRDAFAAVAAGAEDLLKRFDWDGVNLAELYFESLEGHGNPSRLTPMNDDVRREFKAAAVFDPLQLFDAQSPRHWTKDGASLGRFLDFRAQLAQKQQAEWIARIESLRQSKPDLDLVLTHIDDRFDTTMREKLGADASRVLPMLARHDFTFLIEDPATIWNLGPQRYPQIAARYAPLTPARQNLAIDINIVERYQDVYPTKQQTGAEFLDLVHTAAGAFQRVALYFEYSLATRDLPWLPAAAASVERASLVNGKLVIESRHGVGVPWKGPALVDGKPWPIASDAAVWLPAGTHAIESARQPTAFRVLEFSGDLKMVAATAGGIEFAYQSSARAMAVLERAPAKLTIDGIEQTPQMVGNVLVLPRGQHFISIDGSR